VVESGTFDELVAKGARFAAFARAKFMVQENPQSAAFRSSHTQPAMAGRSSDG
jgi:hypothetical protein